MKELVFVEGHIEIWVLVIHVLIRLWVFFVDAARTTTPLSTFDERGITYLVATNAGWLPYLTDEGVMLVHYSADRVRRQFRLDQDIPNDYFAIMESATSV